jgi:hypothetical protein
MKQFSLIIIFLLILTQVDAQFGGSSTYDFLNLTSSARVNALGGNQVGMIDESELSLSYYNPATLRPQMHNDITLNYIDYISDIRVGYAAYSRFFEGIGSFAAGMQYINYGELIHALEDGVIIGNFSASDYALNLIYSRNIWDRLHAGINLKPILSSYESYNSFGIAADLGITYTDSTGNFSAGLVFKNMGGQISTYTNEAGSREPLPFDIQAGFSQRLEHAPFRFNVTLQHLLNWKLTDKSTWDYDNRSYNEFLVGRSDDIFKQFMRHLILGVEFIPSKNFIVGVGYNFQRQRELSVQSNPGAVGFSGGFTVKVSKFRVSYALSSYHLSSTSHIFSVSTNLSEFL